MSPLHHCSSVLTGFSGSALVLLRLSGEETDFEISTCCSPIPHPWQIVFYKNGCKNISCPVLFCYVTMPLPLQMDLVPST